MAVLISDRKPKKFVITKHEERIVRFLFTPLGDLIRRVIETGRLFEDENR